MLHLFTLAALRVARVETPAARIAARLRIERAAAYVCRALRGVR